MLSFDISSRRFTAVSLWPGMGVLFMPWFSISAMAVDERAVNILVVTDSRHPVQTVPGAHVIELDLPARIEAQITTPLPNDPDQAAAQVRQRLREGGDPLQQRIRDAYQGVVDAWQLGINKIPAVVVDQRYVVYGEPNVARALARITIYRSTQQ